MRTGASLTAKMWWGDRGGEDCAEIGHDSLYLMPFADAGDPFGDESPEILILDTLLCLEQSFFFHESIVKSIDRTWSGITCSMLTQ